MFNRKEATEIFGKEWIISADEELEKRLDNLLRRYEDDFHWRRSLYIARLMESEVPKIPYRFIGGVVESRAWGYVFETTGTINQSSELPPNVNVQLPPGQPMPLIPGLSRKYKIVILEQRWKHNIEPVGVTV